MKVIWLQMFFFLFPSSNPTYLRGALHLLNHPNDNPCEDIFKNQWPLLNLSHTEGSLDYVCKFHADRYVYIAVLRTVRTVPVYWAYQVHHEETTAVLDQGSLKNIWNWYIPPKVIGDILLRNDSSSQRMTVRTKSFSITHIVSGVVPADNKHVIYISNWRKMDCIQWIAYNHTSPGGVTLDGAAIRIRNQWKHLSVVQLADLLSITYTNANVFRKFSGYQKVSKHVMDIPPKKSSPTHVKKPGRDFMEEENTVQIEQDSVEESEKTWDVKVEVPEGKTLDVSPDSRIPEESRLDHTEEAGKDSKHDLELSRIAPEKASVREAINRFLAIFWDMISFRKTKSQLEIVPPSLKEVPKEIASTEVTTVTPETTSILTIPDKTLSTFASTREYTTYGKEHWLSSTNKILGKEYTERTNTEGTSRKLPTNNASPSATITKFPEGPHTSERFVTEPQTTEEIVSATKVPETEPTEYLETGVTETAPSTVGKQPSTMTSPKASSESERPTVETECTTEQESPTPESDTTTPEWETAYIIVDVEEPTEGVKPPEYLETGFTEMVSSESEMPPTTEAEYTEGTTTSQTTKEKETTEAPLTTKITEEPETECTENTVPILPFTPEPNSPQSTGIIKTTSIPDTTFPESLGTECAPATTTNKKETPSKPTVSQTLGKSTPETLPPSESATTTHLPELITNVLATEHPQETEGASTMAPTSEDPSICTCYGLIHRSPAPAALKRCLEKTVELLKFLQNTARSHLTSTTSRNQPSTQTTFRSQDDSRKTGYHSKLKDDGNEHFYYIDGKLKEKNNHSGPEVDKI